MSGAPVVLEALRERLTQALSPEQLRLSDDSALHAGHPGAGAGGHYRLHIVAACFEGRGLLERHRLVYTAVADLMHAGVHALQIEALAPSEVT